MSIRDYIHGWSGFDFKPETYYIDFTDKIDNDMIENYCDNNDIIISDDEREKAIIDIKNNLRILFVQFQLNETFIDKMGFVSTFNKPYKIKELATNKDVNVLVIGSTADTLIVTFYVKGMDYLINYLPIAFVPVIKFDDLYQILFDAKFDDNKDLEEYSSKIHRKTFKLYDKSIRQFKHESTTILNAINKYFKNGKIRKHSSKRDDIVGYIPKKSVNKKPKS